MGRKSEKFNKKGKNEQENGGELRKIDEETWLLYNDNEHLYSLKEIAL